MPQPYYILTFDTSMNACSAGVYNARSDKMLAVKHEPMVRGQAERLIPQLNEVLDKSDLSFDDISAIACTHGPGAFTGIRVGLSAAKALSLSLSIPAIGVSTLDLISEEFYHTQCPQNAYLVCIETKRDDYYTRLFSAEGEPLSEMGALTITQLYDLFKKSNIHKINIVGDATLRFHTDFTEYAKKNNQSLTCTYHKTPYINCLFLARKAYNNLEEMTLKKKELINILPLYLKKPNITISSPKS